MNSPVMLVDIDGKDILVLNDSEGANGSGHQAILVGEDYNEETDTGGWRLYSKNKAKLRIVGPTTGYEDGKPYNDIYEFLSDKKQNRYDKGLLIKTTKDQDDIVKAKASDQVKAWYGLLSNSCNNTLQCGLDGINEAEGNVIIQPGRSDLPNESLKQLELWNKNNENVGSIIDLNEWRKYIK